ncbi:hypothetical protein EAO77_19160 [Streptomyces sp. t39]|nr:hypothetical protein EAO77_19160 [Streptomyces sp. t39]
MVRQLRCVAPHFADAARCAEAWGGRRARRVVCHSVAVQTAPGARALPPSHAWRPAMTAPSTPARRPGLPPAVRASLISGAVGGGIGAVMSALVNLLVIGMPDSETVNAVNHAVSGLVSGFLAGFAGLFAHLRRKPAAPEA